MQVGRPSNSTMRKQGPCGHCGVKETPLWRNGPPGKPVLCNACGSRWRIRGNLDDYVPNKRGSVIRRGKKRSRKNHNPLTKWVENEEEEEEGSNDEDDSDKEWKSNIRYPKTRHGGSGSETITTSEEPRIRNLYEDVVQSEIVISDDNGDGSDDSNAVLNDDEYPLAHIKVLQRELYKMLKKEKSLSSSSSASSSFSESPVEDEVLLYNVRNPHFSENEIGLGSFLLKRN